MTPRVSIAIPTYNQPQFNGQAVQSALTQDYANLEVIVSDDASVDPLVQAALDPYRSDARLRIMTHAQNVGRVANYRRALYEYMTGDWALILDGDDALIDPTYVSGAIEKASRIDGIVLAFGGCRMVSNNRYHDHLQSRLKGESDITPDGLWQVIDGRDYFLQWGVWLGVPHQSALYRRSLAMQLDFYRYNIISSDWESLRRLILHGRVIICRKPVAIWRRHSIGASNDVDLDSRIADLQSICEPYRYAQSFELDAAALKKWRSDVLADYAIDTYRVGLDQAVTVDVRPLLTAIEKIDRIAEQHARNVIHRSLVFMIKRILLRALGTKRFLEWMATIHGMTWPRITALLDLASLGGGCQVDMKQK